MRSVLDRVWQECDPLPKRNGQRLMADNAWLTALAAEHVAALNAQNDHYRLQPMNSDDGEDA